MKRGIKKSALALTLLLSANVAVQAQEAKWDGPFGLKEGLSRAEIEKIVKIHKVPTPLFFATEKLPIPHPAFSWYALTISESVGLCAILAVGPTEPSDAFGDKLRQSFDALKDPLTSRYGKPTRAIDGVRPGSIWRDPQDFMMGMLKGERKLSAIWDTTKAKPLPSSLSQIALIAGAESSSTGAVSLHYTFSNNDKCEAEKKANENRGL